MNPLLQQFLGLARRSPVAVISIALLIILGGADFVLWRREAEQVQRAERVRQQGEAMLLSLSGQPRIQAQYNATKEALAAIDENLASEADLAGNLDYFYQFEKSARIRLTNIAQLSSQPGAADAHYRAIPFTVRLVGPYAQLLAFVHQVETGPRLLRIRTYRFSQTDSAADSISLDLTVDLLGRP